MPIPDRLAQTLKRLNGALDQLEAAVERKTLADSQRGDLEEELTVMQDDRARLAVELDSALSRSKLLETANSEVARRLERASTTIKAVLDHAPAQEG